MKKKLFELRRLKNNAKRNANRIRKHLEQGLETKADHVFWEGVAKDYARQIKNIYYSHNSITNVSGVGIMKP